MTKTVSCLLYGGLGNQLFQIFTTMAYAYDHGRELVLPYAENLGKRPTYWNNLLAPLRKYLLKDSNVSSVIVSSVMQLDEPYIQEPHHDVQHIVLNGYFQSPKYFHHRKSQILRELGFIEEGFLSKHVSLHFRRGDYKQLPDCHPVLPIDYYMSALDYITTVARVSTVLYFCEDEDHDDIMRDIEVLNKSFPTIVFKSCKCSSDWQEMMVMSACEHNIIANSSFSWWGAYLNPNPHKIVCYPATWFGPMIPKDVSDMFPSDWIKI